MAKSLYTALYLIIISIAFSSSVQCGERAFTAKSMISQAGHATASTADDEGSESEQALSGSESDTASDDSDRSPVRPKRNLEQKAPDEATETKKEKCPWCPALLGNRVNGWTRHIKSDHIEKWVEGFTIEKYKKKAAAERQQAASSKHKRVRQQEPEKVPEDKPDKAAPEENLVALLQHAVIPAVPIQLQPPTLQDLLPRLKTAIEKLTKEFDKEIELSRQYGQILANALSSSTSTEVCEKIKKLQDSDTPLHSCVTLEALRETATEVAAVEEKPTIANLMKLLKKFELTIPALTSKLSADELKLIIACTLQEFHNHYAAMGDALQAKVDQCYKPEKS